MTVTIGVLALQGDVREHMAVLTGCGAHPVAVRRAEELARIDGIVLPGGESTTVDTLLRAFELAGPLREAIAAGLPVLGTCAGMILLAERVLDAPVDQRTLGGLDVTVRRNAFGRQVDSFETDLEVEGIDGGPVHAVFIRAPWIEQVGPGVQVLAEVPDGSAAGRIVAVRQRDVLATAFHPEVTQDDRVHRMFVQIARDRA